MTTQLYYSPGACSLAVHVLLHELNVEHELVKVSPSERPAELVKVNPRSKVPVLVEDGFAIREGAAILLHLCDENATSLMPQSGHERAMALEWLCFGNATLHPAYGRVFGLMRSTVEQSAKEQMLSAAVDVINDLWRDVEQHLSQSEYLCGSQPSVGDILLTVIANWSPKMPKPVTLGPKTKALLQKISSRPSFQKAMQAEQIEYKVAA